MAQVDDRAEFSKTSVRRTMNAARSAIEAKTAFPASDDLSTHDDHDDVDRAPADRDGTILRNAAADLVADRSSGRPRILSIIRIMHRFARRGLG